MPDSILYQDWIKKAAEDERVADHLLSGTDLLSAACFHLQQMAEKLLKALLLYKGREAVKIHDLVALGELIETDFEDVKTLVDDLKRLSEFYVESRYPGVFPEITREEAENAFDSSQRVKEFVLSKIKT